ncbi:hypothetical protein WAI453_005297 [Rhynchosporium graminicola]
MLRANVPSTVLSLHQRNKHITYTTNSLAIKTSRTQLVMIITLAARAFQVLISAVVLALAVFLVKGYGPGTGPALIGMVRSVVVPDLLLQPLALLP